jgi:Xaa-Pro aminopeptidase
MLTMQGCRERQKRLLAAMEANGWNTFLTANYRLVYYFTGALSAAETPSIFLLSRNAGSVLVTSATGEFAADRTVPFETYSIQRTITKPWHDAARSFKEALTHWPGWHAGVIAAEQGTLPLTVSSVLESASPKVIWADASDVILRLRKRKEGDEIDEIRRGLHFCAIAYKAAQKTIAPGLSEVDVYNAMFSAISLDAGTNISFPGDFACGLRGIKEGGAPTLRKIEDGDLYILDIFPAPALYFGDTCRTFAVGPPSDLQHRAWEIVLAAVSLAEGMIRPGVRARDVYWEVKNFLDSHEITQKSFWHHAGHGIGIHGHEAPRIIPGTDDIFEEGDVITIEPGVYDASLQGGIRLEDNYVVRQNGLENLFDYPRQLYKA